jgi:hypothetical protein
MYQRFFLVFFSLFLLILSRFIFRNNVTGMVEGADLAPCEERLSPISRRGIDQPLFHEEIKCQK